MRAVKAPLLAILSAAILLAACGAAQTASTGAYVIYEIGAPSASDAAALDQTRAQSIAVIRRRLSPTGDPIVIAEPRGDRQILVRMAGVADPNVLTRRIGPTGLLTFNLVNDTVSAADVQNGRLPVGTVLAPPFPGIGDNAEVVKSAALLTGAHISRAHPMIDTVASAYVLAFEFDAEGARLFCRVTTDNVGRRFAILLDQQVLTAPNIMEPICGGSGQIAGNWTRESAMEFAAIVNAGALPAPLTLVAQGVGDAPP